MMRFLLTIILMGSGVTLLFAQNTQQSRQWGPRNTEWYHPEPAKLKPGAGIDQPPSDAIALFDGKYLSKWESAKPSDDGSSSQTPWKVENGLIVIVSGTGRTNEYFGNCQMLIEFKLPLPDNEQGNRGVFLQSANEVRISEGENNTLYLIKNLC